MGPPLSIHYLNHLSLEGHRGLEPIPAGIGREAGYTLDRSPVNHRADRQTTTDAHIHTYE